MPARQPILFPVTQKKDAWDVCLGQARFLSRQPNTFGDPDTLLGKIRCLGVAGKVDVFCLARQM